MVEVELGELAVGVTQPLLRILRLVHEPVGHERERAAFLLDHDRDLGPALDLAREDLGQRGDVFGHDTLAWALHKNGRHEEAAESITRALALGTALIRRAPALPEARKELARAYSSQGLVHAARGRFAAAEAAYRRALALREALVRDFPAVADYR